MDTTEEPKDIDLAQLDADIFALYCSALYSDSDAVYGHSDGCRCGRHACLTLPSERQILPFPIPGVENELGQFSTPAWIAEDISLEISEIIGNRAMTFTDLCAGNGMLSQALLRKGFSGIGIEADAQAIPDRLEALSTRLPFGSSIPYKAIFADALTYGVDSSNYRKTNFVVMNPPFRGWLLSKFLLQALTHTNVVFALVPSSALARIFDDQHPLGKDTTFSKIMRQNGVVSYPVKSYPFELPCTRPWHRQASKTLDVVLACFVKNTDPHFSVKEIVDMSLGEPCREEQDYSLLPSNRGTFVKPGNRCIPTTLALGGTPRHEKTFTCCLAFSEYMTSDWEGRVETSWELQGPFLQAIKVCATSKGYSIVYGWEGVPTITLETDLYPFFVYSVGPQASPIMHETPAAFAERMDSLMSRQGIPCRLISADMEVLAEANKVKFLTLRTSVRKTRVITEGRAAVVRLLGIEH